MNYPSYLFFAAFGNSIVSMDLDLLEMTSTVPDVVFMYLTLFSELLIDVVEPLFLSSISLGITLGRDNRSSTIPSAWWVWSVRFDVVIVVRSCEYKSLY